MKTISISLVALTVALLASSAAHADTTPGWYAAAGVGDAIPEDPAIHAGTTHNGKDVDAGLDLLGSAGYALDMGLRFEGEYFHNQTNAKTIDGVAASGHISNNAAFLNAFYDFKTGKVLSPYIGAGIGPDFVGVRNVGVPGSYLNGDTVVAAYQAIAGASAQLDKNWAITADYRYVSSFDPKVGYTGGSQGRITNASHNIVLGVRYSFGAEEPAAPLAKVEPPKVAPYVPAKAAVAPVAQSFMVFFDFDKSVLTPEAKKIIAAAAQKFQKDGYAAIDVTGHTDTVGTKAYNLKLSERRALAVKAELEKLGVKTANIKETGVGKNGLLVPTTDGVREAQNRRAEIVLEK
jgi:outer membrane protein OmpA-like peptidoglycan-associated protein